MLRPIDPDDVGVAERIVEIQRAAYRVEADLIGFDAIPPLHETIGELQSQRLCWCGSFQDQTLAGVIGWTVVNGVCDIDRLAVDPPFARQGHGRLLVSHLLNHRAITVSTGTENLPAFRLYESLGFVPVGERRIANGITVTAFERYL